MEKIEVTFNRALKIWWSFIWRTWILMIPLALICLPLMHFLLPFPKPGEPPDMNLGQKPGFLGLFFIIWLVMMMGMVVLQTLAIKWTIKTKWSDFELKAIPTTVEHQNLPS
jgi:Na+-driven multidrug efflux pump